jgi:ferrous iron transport protein B
MVAVAAMRQEFGARWMWTQIGYTLALAWIAAVLVFQVGKLFVVRGLATNHPTNQPSN